MNTEWNPSKKGNHYVWRGVFLWKMTNHRNKTNPSSAYLHQPSVPLSFLSTGGKMRQSNAANCHRSNSDSGAQTEIKLFICVGTVTTVSVWPLHIKKNKFFLPFSFELTEIIWFYLSFGERMLLSSRELFPNHNVQGREELSLFCWVILKHGLQKDVGVPWVSTSKCAGREKVFKVIHWVLAKRRCLRHSRNLSSGRQFVREGNKRALKFQVGGLALCRPVPRPGH